MSGQAVCFIVPIHNRWDLAEPLLRSLVATTAHRNDVDYLVIDDGSTPEVRAEIDALPPPFRIHHNERNEGFGRTINRAIPALPHPYVVLLNSDLVLPHGWLEPMLAVMEAEPEAIAVGNVQTAVASGEIDHAGMVFHQEGYPIHFNAPRDMIHARSYREFPAVTAACVVVRRDRFMALGGFDELFRNGFEDVDLCLRARMRGWPSFVASHSWVGHHISASPGRSDHEAVNARAFLARWRPLTSVWQRDWENRVLRERRELAGELPALVASDRTSPPSAAALRVMIDATRLEPDGAKGGMAIVLGEFMRELHFSHRGELTLVLVIRATLIPEALAWIGSHDEIWSLPPATAAVLAADPRVHQVPATESPLARLLDADVLYCPHGVSDFQTPDIPTVAVAMDLFHREMPECLPASEVAARDATCDRLVRTSFRIQCQSQWVAGRMRHHFGATEDQVFIVHNAVHNRLGSPSARAPAHQPIFYYPANAWPHKNHDTLLVAYHLYRAQAGTSAWQLVLAGHPDAAMDRVAGHARALGLSDQVSFPGFVMPAELEALWAQAGALVFPSLHEGFGLPVLEAMHLGVPVVAGRIPAIAEVAGDAFHATDVRDPFALADALREISSNAHLRSTLVERGRRRVAAFTLAAETERLAVALRDAVAQFRRAGITWRWDAPLGRS